MSEEPLPLGKVGSFHPEVSGTISRSQLPRQSSDADKDTVLKNCASSRGTPFTRVRRSPFCNGAYTSEIARSRNIQVQQPPGSCIQGDKALVFDLL
ncbi:hypothetical protein [Nannocystis sp. SCPEA4]|uniref:hypothetical protein n=1 Tax=Nannocystis sp. SCPEA4 TaxID=2996787 RepID=UPI00226D4EFC|nr:hypothetical protein [Nannocystis sp. SCPEA4]MCY1060788.1 hypothetical protein [Nannocystis sp. SCPEA4]